MKKRLGLFLAGAFLLAVFGIGTIVSLLIFAVNLLWFLFTGSERARNFVGFKGKSLDQVCNAVYLKGHPKETVSSHAGRWIISGLQLPLWVTVVDRVTSIAEDDHPVKAIEEPFRNLPLQD